MPRKQCLFEKFYVGGRFHLKSYGFGSVRVRQKPCEDRKEGRAKYTRGEKHE